MKDAKQGLKLSSTVFKMRENIALLEQEKTASDKREIRTAWSTIMSSFITGALIASLPLHTQWITQPTLGKMVHLVGIVPFVFATVISRKENIVAQLFANYVRKELVKAKKEYLDLIGEEY